MIIPWEDLSAGYGIGLRLIRFDVRHRGALPPPRVVDQKFRIHTEHPVQQRLVRLGDLPHSRDPCTGQPVHGPFPHFPEIGQRFMVPQRHPIGLLAQYPDVVLHMLRRDVQRHLCQIEIGPDPGSRRIFQDVLHHPDAQLFRGHLIHLQIIRHIHKNFVDTVNVDILLRDIFQINTVDLSRIVDIELHPRRSHDISDPLRDLKHPASPGDPHGFHRRGYGETDGLLRPLRIRHNQIGSHRIQMSLPALHRSIE